MCNKKILHLCKEHDIDHKNYVQVINVSIKANKNNLVNYL